MSSIIVTGGLGFIGSHIVVQLIEKQYKPIILDNLSNSKLEVLDKIEWITGIRPEFHKIDLANYDDHFKLTFAEIAKNEPYVHAVIHCAGLKAVNESIKMPLIYYHNNLISTMNLLLAMEQYDMRNLIFSSSATVYGSTPMEIGKRGILETDETGKGITNPYGMTKYMIEIMLKDLCNSSNEWKIIDLRYFNPIGAHPSGKIGEDPLGIPNNLMPVILRSILDQNQIKVFGNDYDTVDGTCIRDYIHVMDLAAAHIAAIVSLNKQKPGNTVYNLGTGKGTTVLELINTFERINNVKINWTVGQRREGDLAYTFCDATKALNELGWKAERDITDMCKTAWVYAELSLAPTNAF